MGGNKRATVIQARVRDWHTPGQSKQRDRARAELRTKLLDKLTAVTYDRYVGALAADLGISIQATVGALQQLVRTGEVERVDTGMYRAVPYTET